MLQSPGSFQDSFGAPVEEWADVAPMWAEISPISAREFVASGAEQSKITVRIKVRYRTDIMPHFRFYHQASGNYYNIEGALPDVDSNREYITLPCSQGVRV